MSFSSKTKKTNIDKAKLDELSKSVASVLNQAQSGVAEKYAFLDDSVAPEASKDHISLNVEQRSEVFSVARKVLSKLESIHRSAQGDVAADAFQFGCLPTKQGPANILTPSASRNSWNDIYNSDRILVSESLDDSQSIGTLRATCDIDAPPSVVHKLLTEFPEVGLLSYLSLFDIIAVIHIIKHLIYIMMSKFSERLRLACLLLFVIIPPVC